MSVERILVPTDTSEFSNLALQYALLFQKRLGSSIALLYAEEFSFLLSGEYPIGYYFENSPDVKKRATEQLRKYAQEHVPDTARVTTMIIDDTPARATLIAADDLDADLILMGTHGRHGLRRALLGSVTERVLRETDRPVMTVAPRLMPADATVRIQTILCPVNFTTVAHQALDQACSLGQAFQAQLVVVHVREPQTSVNEDLQMRFSGWIDPVIRKRLRYHQIVVNGDPAAQVLEISDQIGADLVVVGAQHKRFFDSTVMGTTTERVTRFARQPVLTVIRRTPAAETDNPVIELERKDVGPLVAKV